MLLKNPMEKGGEFEALETVTNSDTASISIPLSGLESPDKLYLRFRASSSNALSSLSAWLSFHGYEAGTDASAVRAAACFAAEKAALFMELKKAEGGIHRRKNRTGIFAKHRRPAKSVYCVFSMERTADTSAAICRLSVSAS